MWLARNIVFYLVNFVVFQFSCANYLNQFETWYSRQIFLYAAAILFLVMLFKLRSKWTGVRTLNANVHKYKLNYVVPLSKRFMRWTILFYGTETIISLIFPFIYLYFDTLTWPFSGLLLLNGIEGLLFLWINRKQNKFKIGINENAIVHNARGVYVLPFHELKSIEYKYDEFFFIYTNGETLTLPEYIVEDMDTVAFRKRVVEEASARQIFYSDRLMQHK